MAGFAERMRAKYTAQGVNPNRAQQLIRGDGESSVQKTEGLDQIDDIVSRIVPSNYPEYKRKKLEESVINAISRYGIDVVLELNSGDLNAKGQIAEKSLISIRKSK